MMENRVTPQVEKKPLIKFTKICYNRGVNFKLVVSQGEENGKTNY